MPTGDSRGQTSVDFAISMGVLLIAVVTAIAFLPQITGPFVDLPGENPMIADRTADQLVETQLTVEDEPGTLDAVCTVHFFANQSDPECTTFDDSEPINEKLGLTDDVHVNVTIEQDVTGDVRPDVLCGNSGLLDEGTVTDAPCTSPGEFRLAAGDDVPAHKSVAEARRMVLLDGRQGVFVRIKVWK